MATKKKKHPSEESSNQARPGMLAMAVVLAATASTWYWYQPLKDNSSTSSVEEGLSKRFVDNQNTLIEPNTNDAIPSNASAVPIYSNLPADLIGDRQVELRPFQVISQGTLQERLSKEPLPVLPISRPVHSRGQNASELVTARPPIWTNMEPAPAASPKSLLDSSSSKLADWESASPMKSGALAAANSNSMIEGNRMVAIGSQNPSGGNSGASGWPDRGFNPESQLAGHGVSDQRAANPPLTLPKSDAAALARSTQRTSGKIMLAETSTEESYVAMPRKSIPTAWTGSSQNQSELGQTVKKSGAVIRQPKQ